ncbi:TPR domain-containing protein, putative [Eimeria tenella]|uniref:TPR domain-containing protein, putative n=1 Tax=Eimeria tenella TaxID=5802 RepID=U6L843_EIMTE|nr:TPR domain-containing protein, putative [Eimeria tenella]CDJ43920.1 TPR domain-containing protein, putative [Eimeria tenella]|eukprot:XP_013234669.1 TPR domain-containing protein, putative [Eimeria tenella]
MGVLYLWFGDALLSLEESKDDVLAQLPQAKTAAASSSSSSSSTAAAEKKDEGEVSDDELAFQMLELAKKCLATLLNYIPAAAAAAAEAAAAEPAAAAKPDAETPATPKAETPKADAVAAATDPEAAAAATTGPAAAAAATDAAAAAAATLSREEIVTAATDLSFACMRLGDLQLMNNRFQDATEDYGEADYGEAVRVRGAFALGSSNLLAPSVSLAQSLFFSGDISKALETFKAVLLLQALLLSLQLRMSL